jgi:two-component system chemotaxis sensor kinase CheA
MLRATFKVEAAEHLQAITSGLLELEKGGASADATPAVIERVFRAAHSLKGAARAVNFAAIEGHCQALEDLFARWRRGGAALTAETLDLAHATLDKISAALTGERVPSQSGARRDAHSSSAPQPAALESSTPAPSPRHGAAGGDTDTVRIPVSSLDSRLLQAEEMLAAKLVAAQRAADLGALAAEFEEWHKAWTAAQPHARELRQAVEHATNGARAEIDGRAPAFASLVEFLEWNQDRVRALEAKVRALRRAAEHDNLLVARLVDDLLESSKKLVMLPMATLGTLLPKAVRDLSRDEGKDTDFVLRGEDVRIDKRILDEMQDPLLHLLRNCVDHGIETPDVRRRSGKPARATITLAVTSGDGNQVEMRVSDDGAGIDVARVKAVAIQRNVITQEAAARLTDEAALQLVFEPDLSTSPIITEVSGRGLGLAIVREKAERLGGRVSIASQPGHGTDIRITLPLTLATFRGVLVEAEQRVFVVPTAQVERVTRFKTGDVQTVEGRETLSLDGRAVALARLADVLGLPATHRAQSESKPAIILGAGEQRLAFAVDSVLDEREVLVKPLKKPLVRVRNIAGATVLGSGAVVPILNVADLLKSARNAGTPARTIAVAPASTSAKRILVAEDSITSRMLIKGMLESAGYRVKTVVDGVEAFAALRAEPFDCVVSDVEMPRMDGFDLTARIRADRALGELPVVLVTALDSREDKERGVDVGANAYLVKSSLDQANLLETLRRLA